MRCGICGSDNPTYSYGGKYQNERPTTLTVQNAVGLVQHKRQQHPDEYKASLQRRKDTKAEHERAARDFVLRRWAAGDAASRTVLYRDPYGDSEVSVTTTRDIELWTRLEGHRYPEPKLFHAYEDDQLEITRLQNEAALALEGAFAQGTPVPQEDVERVKAAMDAVPREEVRRG